MTIYDIKARVAGKTHYFDKDTLQFFGQTMRSFHVEKMADGRYHVWAPSYWHNHGKRELMGISETCFNPETDTLEDVPEEIKKSK